jgi:hypothetical protein
MPPAKQDLTIYQGDDFRLRILFSASGAPVDMSGHSFAAQVRAGPVDANPDPPLASFTCTLSDPVGGELVLELPHSATAALGATAKAWDLQSTDPAGKVTTYVSGAVAVTLEVTRP